MKIIEVNYSDIVSILEGTPSEDLRCMSKINRNEQCNTSFVALENNLFLGGIAAEIVHERCNIRFMTIALNCRCEKIGKTLIDKIQQFSKLKGCNSIMVTTCDCAFLKFYLKIGFEICGMINLNIENSTIKYFLNKDLR